MATLSGTAAQMADFLIFENWASSNESPRRWQPGSTVTYSIGEDWPPEAVAAIHQALQLWSDLIPLAFAEVATGGALLFEVNDRDQAIAQSSLVGPDSADPRFQSIGRSTISIDTSAPGWSAGDYDLGGYGLETLLHEIGHSLGLGHSGYYNGSLNDDGVVLYTDSRQYTLMSYRPAEVTGASHRLDGSYYASSTPLLYDIYAIQQLYGARAALRPEDTVYGFNSTAGEDVYDFTVNEHPVIAIYDTGGHNVLDLSGFETPSRIDLHAGAISDAGGLTGNIAIAYGTAMGGAYGGSGDDLLIANDLGNELRGGEGDDILVTGGGNDLLIGGEGHDTAVLHSPLRLTGLEDLGDGTIVVEGRGIMFEMEAIRFSDGLVTYDGSGDGAAVVRLYAVALGREADAAGLQHWAMELSAGETDAPGLASGFMASDEFTALTGDGGPGAVLDLLYTHLRGTPGSAEERQFWLDQLADGLDPAQMLAFFADSEEARALTEDTAAAGIWTLDVEAVLLSRLYDTMFGRLPDAGGFDAWMTWLRGDGTLADVARAMLSAPEWADRFGLGPLDAEEVVTGLFANALGRAPEAEALTYWTAALEADGYNPIGVILQISESEEHRALTMGDLIDPLRPGIAFLEETLIG
jgi:hypothetical protein